MVVEVAPVARAVPHLVEVALPCRSSAEGPAGPPVRAGRALGESSVASSIVLLTRSIPRR